MQLGSCKQSELPEVVLKCNLVQKSKPYSTKDSCVVTHRSTNSAIRSLTMGERTGSRIFFNLWPYVKESRSIECKAFERRNKYQIDRQVMLIWVSMTIEFQSDPGRTEQYYQAIGLILPRMVQVCEFSYHSNCNVRLAEFTTMLRHCKRASKCTMDHNSKKGRNVMRTTFN
ncbi:hypothetical protein BJ508DRAFT_340257 [Ascobolus immersus RN42]|uniref:Uncharacterized protein n=1 Tax=Ascobolus immersus RN42 TaxID=1160509 RepID=A0A3N4HXD3_ASCIM|nr:hypothetical protein BJ508DRAFT_340257 [Ascobolus immersus RN42]